MEFIEQHCPFLIEISDGAKTRKSVLGGNPEFSAVRHTEPFMALLIKDRNTASSFPHMPIQSQK